MRVEFVLYRFSHVFGRPCFSDQIKLTAEGFSSIEHADAWGQLQACIMSANCAAPYFLANVTELRDPSSPTGGGSFICHAIPEFWMANVDVLTEEHCISAY